MLDFSVVNCRAFLVAVWECKFGITAVITVLTSISLVTFALNVIYVSEVTARLRSSMRIADYFADMVLIKNALDMTIFKFINLFETLLTLFAVMARVWIRADTVSIV